MKNRYFKYFIVIFLIFTFFIFYYGLKEKNFYTPEDISIKKFPNLILNDFYTDNKTSFDDILKGNNYYLVNIWASWCLPCREEHPYLVQLKKNLSIKIIGINYKDKRDNALKFLDEYENPYLTILTDNNGIASIEIGAYGVPESFILNKEKKIIKKIIGPINKKKFNEIKELIKK
jgi:cytochrome c biogenesis protein CcmG/thiol:disulfide interchange protein DsbE